MKTKKLPMSPSTISSQAHRLWTQRATSGRDQLVIFSPYVTDAVASRLVSRFTGTGVEVYTTFDAETFVARGSSLNTLRKLQEQGVRLFSLPGLHAKIVCIDDTFLSVGSQNLTHGGTRNKEATLVFRDKSVVSPVLQQLKPWRDAARPITPTMIDLMMEAIEPHLKQSRKLKKQLIAIDQQVTNAEAARVAVVARQKLLNMQQLLKRLPTSSEAVHGVIRDPHWSSNSTSSYLAAYGVRRSFLHWTVGGTARQLEGTKRYLTLREDNGWLGWGRVNQTRITFVANSLTLDDFSIGNRRTQLKIQFPWKRRMRDFNVEFTFGGSTTALQLRSWFNTETLSDFDVDPSFQQSETNTELREYILSELRRNQENFAASVIKRLRKPFVYRTRLTGKDASGFFSGHGSFELKVKLQDSQIMLVATPA